MSAKRLLLPLLAVLCLAQLSCFPRNTANVGSFMGVNLSRVDSGNTEFPFADVFKQARDGWISFPLDSFDWSDERPVAVDQDGWVQSLLDNQGARSLVWWDVPVGAVPGGQYVVHFEGTGSLRFVVDTSTEITPALAGEGRLVLDVPDDTTRMHMEILATDPLDPIRKIEIFLPGGVCGTMPTRVNVFQRVLSAAQCNEEQTFYPFEQRILLFNPDFLARIRYFKTLRFMEPMRTNNSPIVNWADRARLADATWSSEYGVPPELLVGLANLINADAWVTIPHGASDDYVEQLANEFRTKLRTSLKVYLEFSNEVWATDNIQHYYAQQNGFDEGLFPEDDPTTTDDDWVAEMRWYVKRSGEIFDLWNGIMQDSERTVNVLSGQTVNTFLTEQLLQYDPAVTAKADAFGIAPYFYDPNDDVLDLTIDEHFDLVESQSLPQAFAWTEDQIAKTAEFGLPVIAYEGGQSLGRFLPITPEATERFVAMNRHPRMADLYEAFLDHWRLATCGDILAAPFAHYLDIAPADEAGRWGLLEHLYQPPTDPTPKYDAVLETAFRLCPSDE